MIERLAALLRRFDRDVQVFADAVLADVLVQRTRAQPRLVLDVFDVARRFYETVVRPADARRVSVCVRVYPWSIMPVVLHHRTQDVADEAFERRVGHLLQGLVDGFFRGRPLVAEVDERRQQVVAHLAACRGRHG